MNEPREQMDQIDQLWEASRDGELTDAQRRELDDALAAAEGRRAIFDAETKWLEELASRDEETTRQGGIDSDAFVAATMTRWQAERRGGVIARIGFVRVLRWAGAVAAMIAVAVGGAMMSGLFDSPQPEVPPVVVNNGDDDTNPSTPDQPTEPDHVSALMKGASQTYALATTQPAALRDAVAGAGNLLDMDNLVSLLDPGVPDPAGLTEPKTPTKS